MEVLKLSDCQKCILYVNMMCELDFSQWYSIANTRFLSNQSICNVWLCYVQGFRRRCIYKKVHHFTFDIDFRSGTTQNVAQYPLHHMTYAPSKFEVAMSNGLGGNAFTRNTWFDLNPRSRSHEALPSTLCDLCTCKVWSYYGQRLRRCIKKIHWDQGHTKCCPVPSTSCHLCISKVRCCYVWRLRRRCICIMWPNHLQSLKLLGQKV